MNESTLQHKMISDETTTITTTTNQCISNDMVNHGHNDNDDNNNNSMSIEKHNNNGTLIDNSGKNENAPSLSSLDNQTSLFRLKEEEPGQPQGDVTTSQTENLPMEKKVQQDFKKETESSSPERSTTTSTNIIIKTETNEFKPIHHPSNFPMIMPSSSTRSISTNQPSNTLSKESNDTNTTTTTTSSSSKLVDQTTNNDTDKNCNEKDDDNDNGHGGSVVQKNEVEGLQPNLYDVLCGRGGVTNNHVGNKRFRSLVATYQPVYLTCRKIEKSIVAKNIVDIVHQYGGRFLKKQGTRRNFFWMEADMKKAIEKTSQALREGLDVRQNKSSIYKHTPPTTTTKMQNNPEFHPQQPQSKRKLVKIQHHATHNNDQVRPVHLDHYEEAKKQQLKQQLKQLHEQHKRNHSQQKTEVLVSTSRQRMKKKMMNDGTTRVYVTDDTG